WPGSRAGCSDTEVPSGPGPSVWPGAPTRAATLSQERRKCTRRYSCVRLPQSLPRHSVSAGQAYCTLLLCPCTLLLCPFSTAALNQECEVVDDFIVVHQ